MWRSCFPSNRAPSLDRRCAEGLDVKASFVGRRRLVEGATLAGAASLLLRGGKSAAQTSDASRRALVGELANALWGASVPFVERPDRRGWEGVALASPGTSLAALTEGYGSHGTTLQTAVQTLASNTLFDRQVEVRSGVAYFSQRALSGVWQDFLARAMPPRSIREANRTEVSAALQTLFQQPDAVDRARGISLMTEPSAAFIRYREYEDLYGALEAGGPTGLWRLHPRLVRYTSLDEARRAILNEWNIFGFKAEIERAVRTVERSSSSPAWREWARARALIIQNQTYAGPDLPILQSYLFPPPAAWSEQAAWLRLQSRLNDGSAEFVSFQLARINVVRPWLYIEGITERKLAVNTAAPENAGYILSDGSTPTYERTPGGQMSAYVGELLLVRGIRMASSGAPVPTGEHPLSLFAYPNAINLLGYVIRVLPRYPE